MPAYVVASMAIHDPETYRKYTDRSPALIKKYGGKFLTRGDEVTAAEGEPFTGPDGYPRVSQQDNTLKTGLVIRITSLRLNSACLIDLPAPCARRRVEYGKSRSQSEIIQCQSALKE